MLARPLGGVRLTFAVTLFLLLPFASGPARANEFYYVVIFSAQRDDKQPQYTHTFAAFVKAVGDGPAAENYRLETHTLSWLAATLEVHLHRFRPELGVNLDLETSFAVALSQRERVSLWGPFRIEKELYDRALSQIARLECGEVAYKALDHRFRPGRASNCFHVLRGCSK